MKTILLLIITFLSIPDVLSQEPSELKYHSTTLTNVGPRIFPSQTLESLELGIIQEDFAVIRYGNERQVASPGVLLAKESLEVVSVLPGQLLVKTLDGFGLIVADKTGRIQMRQIRKAHLPEDWRRKIEAMQRDFELPGTPELRRTQDQ